MKEITAKSKPLQAFVFDAYGTLFDVHSVVSAANKRFPGQGPALSKAWRTRQLEYTWLRALMGRYEDFWAITESALVASCNELHLGLDGSARTELMECYLRLDLFPEVKRTLNSLADFKLAILSNGTPRMLQSALDEAGLNGLFSHVLSVDPLRTYKPNPVVYDMAAKALAVDKDKIGFVSANYWDIAGANSFGFRTYWVNRFGANSEELGEEPDGILRSLEELPGVSSAS